MRLRHIVVEGLIAIGEIRPRTSPSRGERGSKLRICGDKGHGSATETYEVLSPWRGAGVNWDSAVLGWKEGRKKFTSSWAGVIGYAGGDRIEVL